MKELVLKEQNLEEIINLMKDQLSNLFEVSRDKIKFVGVRLYFVDEEHDILQTTSLFSKDFNPKDYEE